MERRVLDEVYELLETEGDADFSHELLGWLNREPEINANIMIVEADWEAGTVTVYDDLNADWSAQMTVEEFRSIVHTHMIATTLQGDADTAISREYADSLRDDHGVRVEDLERMGIRVVSRTAHRGPLP